MKNKFIFRTGVLSVFLFFSFQTVIASENKVQKNIENKGFNQDTTLSVRIKNNFVISHFSDYFAPSQYAVKKFNQSFLGIIHKLPSISELEILPVYGYFPHPNQTIKASARQVEKN